MNVRVRFVFPDDGSAPLAEDDLCTKDAWADFGQWVNSLPGEGNERILEVCEYGFTYRVAELRNQLTAAARANKPPESVAGIVENLAALCVRHAKATSVVVGGT